MAKPAFPHMFPRDVPLFAAFVLSREAEGIDRWAFDVKVGIARDPGPVYAPNMREMGKILSQLRIDAVGYRTGGPTIYEVKPDARLAALGQLLTYGYWYARQFTTPPNLAVITDRLMGNEAEAYRHYHVAIHLVQPATLEQVAVAKKKVYAVA